MSWQTYVDDHFMCEIGRGNRLPLLARMAAFGLRVIASQRSPLNNFSHFHCFLQCKDQYLRLNSRVFRLFFLMVGLDLLIGRATSEADISICLFIILTPCSLLLFVPQR